jgi:signal transduction histidine kinase
LINFSLVVTINYLVILEIRKVEKNVINVINSDEPTEAAKLKLLTLNKNIFVSTPLSQSLENLILKINQLNKMKIEHSKNKTARDIAKQVAHDIRAPLSALNIVASKLSNADESVVGLMTAAIKRINDIASDLLKKNETLPEESHMQFCELQKNFRELQLEFNTRFPSIQFDLNFMKIPEEQLFLINKKNFSRALSNLLNNAAEAIQHDHGKICIDIQSQPDGLLIKMSDNGSGIPKEIIDKLGQSGFSYNKSNGNGLGLAHAFNTVKSTGGSILINSKLGEGTDINIKILRFTGNAYHNLNFI